MAICVLYENYIHAVEDILEYVLSEEEEINIKNNFFKLFERNLKDVRGLIIGVLEKDYEFKSSRLRISTGMHKSTDLCFYREKMLETLSSALQNDILMLRLPFISTRKSNNTKRLIEAFEPVLRFVLRIITTSKQGEFKLPTPILTLGKNSYVAVQRALEITNRPNYIILPSVHPTFMSKIYHKINKNQVNVKKQETLKKIMESEYSLFDENVYYFKLITQKYNCFNV